jgi:hypothetical protein
MTILQKLRTSEPVAFGGFSELHVFDGTAVKIQEDACYQDVLEECYRQNLAAEAGLAPKVHMVMELDGEVIVSMDAIDTNEWYHPDACDDVAPTLLGELNEVEMQRGLKLYCKLLKAGVLHADFHSGNWFLNDDCEAIAIDFGIASELHEAPAKHIMRAVQFMLPALEQLGYDILASDLLEAWQVGPEVARVELARIARRLA